MSAPDRDKAGKGAGAKAPTVNPAMYKFVQLATGIPMWLGGGLTVEGREHIPLQGPVVVAGSHEFSLDPFVISHGLPRGRYIQYMSKKELFDNPILRFVIGTGGSFPVDRSGNDTRAIRAALRVLQAGGMLGIFPQGTRGGSELHGGVALLALKGKAPVVPAAVWYDKPGRRWHVRFGPPLPPEGSIKDFTVRVGEAIRQLR